MSRTELIQYLIFFAYDKCIDRFFSLEEFKNSTSIRSLFLSEGREVNIRERPPTGHLNHKKHHNERHNGHLHKPVIESPWKLVNKPFFFSLVG
jgi:hypothetical protein